MDNATTILPKGKSDFPEYLDFDRLRAEGLQHIADLSGRIWTDHNVHDPGITILEALCYALTDLGYRTNLPEADLFARDPKTRAKATSDDNFTTAAEILGSNPLTLLDFRKLLIDIEGVRNAWLEPIETIDPTSENPKNVLWTAETKLFVNEETRKLDFKTGTAPLSIKGVYNVLLELEPEILKSAQPNACHFVADVKATVLAEVEKRLHEHRNLCEDFLNISILEDENISLCGEIELESDVQPDEVAGRIFERLQEFLSPTIRFYTLTEMLDNGKTIDEIFEGRPYRLDSHGFIDADALDKTERRQTLYVSDIYRVLLDTEGVEAVKGLRIFSDKSVSTNDKWILNLKEGFRPVFDAVKSIGGIAFLKRGVPYYANASKVLPTYEKRLVNRYKSRSLQRDALNLSVPVGEYRSDLGEYYSIQHDFPKVYGIGQDNLPEATSDSTFQTGANSELSNLFNKKNDPRRRAQALQLKGYLLFYDHLLANYLAQLANNRALFSPALFNENVDAIAEKQVNQAWFGVPSESFSAKASIGDLGAKFSDGTQVVPQFEHLLSFFQKNGETDLSNYSEGETVAVATQNFPSPNERDRALQQVVDSFDTNEVVINVLQDPKTFLFYYEINSFVGRRLVLKSLKSYKLESDAQKASDKIRFIATLPQSYEHLDMPEKRQYSFALIYRTPQYTAYLRQISESETAFFNRKNRLFDHLLARFSEDFTDYTLLMFAMNKGERKQPEPLELSRRFAADKSRFLKNYSTISHNRSKGFNYKKTANLWSSDNVSGLENRVSKLIGIADQKTKTLNYFDIEQRGATYHFTIKDQKGTVILHSIQDYFTEESVKTALKQALDSGKHLENFEPMICAAEWVYGFRLLDKVGGCSLAVSPDTYGTEVLRDTKMAYAHGVLAGDGFMTDFQTDTEGVHFQLNDDAQKPLFRSAKAMKNEDIALKAFALFVRIVQHLDNWQDVDDASGEGFGFRILSKNRHHLEQEVLAIHPVFYPTKSQRDGAKQVVFEFINNKKRHWQTQHHTSRYQWQLIDNQGSNLLEAFHFFKNGKHTAHALQQALSTAMSVENFELIDDLPNNKCSFYLLWQATGEGLGVPSDTTIRVGCAAHSFPNTEARDRAIAQIQHIARHLSHKWHALTFFDADVTNEQFLDDFELWAKLNESNGSARIWKESPKYSINWYDENGDAGLVSDNRFDTALAAQCAVFELEKTPIAEGETWVINDVAANGGNYTDFTENGGCSYFFRLETTAIRADNPNFHLNPEERAKAQLDLITEAKTANWSAILEKKVASWQFEWLVETTNELLTWILRGYNKRVEKGLAEKDGTDCRVILENIRTKTTNDGENVKVENDLTDPHIELENSDPIFKFYIKNDAGERLAESREYTSAAERDVALIGLINEAKSKPNETNLDIQSSKICECTDSDGRSRKFDPRIWRISDDEDRLARYAQSFNLNEKAEVAKYNLISKLACTPPSKGILTDQYAQVWRDYENIFSDSNGYFFFLLRDRRHSYWQSYAKFDSADEARAAFDKDFLTIIELAKDFQNYNVKQRKDKNGCSFYAIELTDEQGKTVAEAYQKPATTEGVSGLMSRLRAHALLFPIFIEKTGKGFGFHIYNAQSQLIEWESITFYAQLKDAEAAFKRFLDLLKNRNHYRLTTECDGDWRIEIVESLLLDAELFATKYHETDSDKDALDFSWRRVGVFLDILKKVGDAAFAPTVDYLNCCGYGFQVVAEGYRVARHPLSFHSKVDREAERDALWHWWRARIGQNTTSTNVSNSGDKLLKIMDLRLSAHNYRVVDKSCHFDFEEKDETDKIIDKGRIDQKQFRVELFEDDANNNHLFQSFIYDDIYPSEEEAKASFAARVEVSHKAQQAAVFLENLLVLEQSDGSRLLAVTDASGCVITVYEEYLVKKDDAKELKGAIQKIYEQANGSPIIEHPGGGFGFELRRNKGSIKRTVRGFVDADCRPILIELPVFEVVWESVTVFKTAQEAQEAYINCLKLLENKANYARMDNEADGSPSLVLINPDNVVATHPRTYTTSVERQKAWENVQRHIHTEGMHLVEHLLLRPRFVGDALMPIEPDSDDLEHYEAQNESDFDDYIMGADPYSFWITVVLPHWSKRFRDIDFRSFFENTLRREAPAHVAVRILWVNPQQMQTFEKAFRCWLDVIGDAERPDYSPTKSCFLKAFNSLVTTFPLAILHDCSEGGEGEIVVLDKTTLS